jgi:hypothetical protein
MPQARHSLCTSISVPVNVKSFPLAVPHCSSLNRHHYHDLADCGKLRFAPVWEGHEFHSCRNCREINSGFQPLGEYCTEKSSFRSLLGMRRTLPPPFAKDHGLAL